MAKWGFNSGVMVLDVRAMHASYAQLLAHGRSKRWRFFLFDQTLLNEFYEKDFEWLDDRLNARVLVRSEMESRPESAQRSREWCLERCPPTRQSCNAAFKNSPGACLTSALLHWKGSSYSPGDQANGPGREQLLVPARAHLALARHQAVGC